MPEKRIGRKKCQLSFGGVSNVWKFIIRKWEKNRFQKRLNLWYGVRLPGLLTITGLTLWLHGEFVMFSNFRHATRVAKKAQGRGRKRRWSTVIWKWSTYPMWYELTNDPGKFFRMPWRVTYKQLKRVPGETSEKRAKHYNGQKGGKHSKNKIESLSAAAQPVKHLQWDVLEALSKRRRVRLKIKGLHFWAMWSVLQRKKLTKSKWMGESDSANAFLSDWIVVNAASKTEKSYTVTTFQLLNEQP